jgi:tRNA1Val (adenine37-N6)-methyltransferase
MKRNTYFQFKQFRINQEHCAMKVCTDACIFGALSDICTIKSVLDIGTGTGLLALMLAQRIPTNSFHIKAVEADKQAALQAAQNFSASPWSEQLECIPMRIQQFIHDHRNKGFDLIICNPPFYVNSTKPPLQKESMAFHADTELPWSELLNCARACAHASTVMDILLPVQEMSLFCQLSPDYGFYPEYATTIFDHPGHKPRRMICRFTQKKGPIHFQNRPLIIRSSKGGAYTEECRHLLAPYYLFL